MLALLELLKDEGSHWYEVMCFFKFHFDLNLLVGILQELSTLNIKIQHDMVDITTTSATIDTTVFILSRHFYPKVDLCLVIRTKKLDKKISRVYALNL